MHIHCRTRSYLYMVANNTITCVVWIEYGNSARISPSRMRRNGENMFIHRNKHPINSDAYFRTNSELVANSQFAKFHKIVVFYYL